MKIMILVNKGFELDGYLDGIDKCIEPEDCPLKLTYRETDVKFGRYSPTSKYTLESQMGSHSIEEYCINYMFTEEENSSRSDIKFDHLSTLFKGLINSGSLPDCIISVSTSESTPDSQGGEGTDKTVNGCVFLGNQFFAYDCRDLDKPPRTSELDIDHPVMISEEIFNTFFDVFEKYKELIKVGMISLPNYPAEELFCNANSDNVSLGVINMTDYDSYKDADEATYVEFKKHIYEKHIPVGLETTHAVVKMALEANDETKEIPVLFVSPIVDRYCHFKDDVKGTQNHDGSYNAGVVVANMLVNIRDYFPMDN